MSEPLYIGKSSAQSLCSISVQQSQVSQCSNETKMINRSQKQNSLTIDIPEDRNYRLLTFLVNQLKNFCECDCYRLGPHVQMCT